MHISGHSLYNSITMSHSLLPALIAISAAFNRPSLKLLIPIAETCCCRSQSSHSPAAQLYARLLSGFVHSFCTLSKRSTVASSCCWKSV